MVVGEAVDNFDRERKVPLEPLRGYQPRAVRWAPVRSAGSVTMAAMWPSGRSKVKPDQPGMTTVSKPGTSVAATTVKEGFSTDRKRLPDGRTVSGHRTPGTTGRAEPGSTGKFSTCPDRVISGESRYQNGSASFPESIWAAAAGSSAHR